MRELDEFREDLRSAADFTPRSLDFDGIVAAGGRLRRRRRIMAVGGVAAAVLAVAIGITAVTQPEARPALPPAATPTVSPSPQPVLTSMNNYRGPFGDVIDTGYEQWVLFGVRPAGGQAYGLCLGTRDAKGDLEEYLTIDDTAATPAGFHTIQAAMALDGGIEQPAFGYYAGAAKRITVTVGGKAVEAQLAPWSVDPGITVFWFAPGDVTPEDTITNPVAYDAAGAELPRGKPRIYTF
ncbi:hypothetical protein [Actinoplanes sp. RD1]|uniref:hypothetical protein n=1 Tax=Actinoplanes sp. RD1 TaxID=3064538 RepID=UPI00274158BC|nr:hypothetical protein [Actinoplanes sp. RD1]